MPSPEPAFHPAPDPAVSLIATLSDEPRARVEAMVAALERQDFGGELELVIAAPPGDVHILRAATRRWDRGPVRIVDNPSGARSPGLNRALDHARGRYAVRVDARSRPPDDYVRRCVARLERDRSVGVVGGVQQPLVEPVVTFQAGGIRRALANRWLLGNAAYRNAAASGTVDTVYLGAFRTADAVRLRYDEALDANEDYDLCRRYRAEGATVWLEAQLVVPYEPRDSVVDLFRQYHAFGRAKVIFWRHTGEAPAARQVVALTGAAVALIGLGAGLRRPRRLAAGAALLVGAVALTDELSHRTEAAHTTLAIRASSIVAHAAIQSGWLSGVAAAGVATARRSRH